MRRHGVFNVNSMLSRDVVAARRRGCHASANCNARRAANDHAVFANVGGNAAATGNFGNRRGNIVNRRNLESFRLFFTVRLSQYKVTCFTLLAGNNRIFDLLTINVCNGEGLVHQRNKVGSFRIFSARVAVFNNSSVDGCELNRIRSNGNQHVIGTGGERQTIVQTDNISGGGRFMSICQKLVFNPLSARSNISRTVVKSFRQVFSKLGRRCGIGNKYVGIFNARLMHYIILEHIDVDRSQIV